MSTADHRPAAATLRHHRREIWRTPVRRAISVNSSAIWRLSGTTDMGWTQLSFIATKSLRGEDELGKEATACVAAAFPMPTTHRLEEARTAGDSPPSREHVLLY